MDKTIDQLAEEAVQKIEGLGVEMTHLDRELARHYIAKALIQAEHQGAMRGIQKLHDTQMKQHGLRDKLINNSAMMEVTTHVE